MASAELKLVRQYNTLGIDDVAIVGGKNASLGEMIKELGKQGVKVRRTAGSRAVYRTSNLLTRGVSRCLTASPPQLTPIANF